MSSQAHNTRSRKRSAAPSTDHPPSLAVAHASTPSVTLFLGPTNSGKTFKALAQLAEARDGVYAAPLRLLAWEAYEKLAGQLGDDAVGLVTGEEQKNPSAPILCCTTECAPLRGKRLLVLDEVHWLADPERGSAWTRVLVGGEYAAYVLCGATEAEPLLRNIFERVQVERFSRRSALAVRSGGSGVSLDDRIFKRREDGRVTCVICFSRAAVHTIAARVQRQGARVAVLYGALPPETRLAHVREVAAGAIDVVVATDVIGHGINLPIDTLAFAEGARPQPRRAHPPSSAPRERPSSQREPPLPHRKPSHPAPHRPSCVAARCPAPDSKFDGEQMRPLHVWEGAQIAGRAGRGSTPGTVCAISEWRQTAPERLERFSRSPTARMLRWARATCGSSTRRSGLAWPRSSTSSGPRRSTISKASCSRERRTWST
jgi:hypothetical protein